MSTVTALADKIRADVAPDKADLAAVLARLGEVLDRSIAGTEIREGPPPIDLSKIDFQALAKRFAESKTKALDLERLKAAIRAQLDRLIAENETRVDFRAKFEALIADYNAGSIEIEAFFRALVDLTGALTEEETRHVREQLSPDELVVFDLLTRPGPDLSPAERDEVKKVARQLLARLRSVLTVDWQKTAQARARIRQEIEEAMEVGLPQAYTADVFMSKAGVVFQHVYERYGVAAQCGPARWVGADKRLQPPRDDDNGAVRWDAARPHRRRGRRHAAGRQRPRGRRSTAQAPRVLSTGDSPVE